jgi:hypothetical protein
MNKPEPQKEHQWLSRMVGEWSMDGEAMMNPGQPSERFKGIERVRSMEGVWIIAEGEGEMPGGGASTSIMILGYDPQKQRFVGTFASMMTNLWIYDGTLEGDVLTLDTEGPGMDGTMAKYKDRIEIKSDDERVMTSHMQTADGSWTQIMTMTLRRTK